MELLPESRQPKNSWRYRRIGGSENLDAIYIKRCAFPGPAPTYIKVTIDDEAE